MIINVTHEDIARGRRVFCDRCPIALAVQRATGNFNAGAGPRSIWFGNPVIHYGTPVSAAEWMLAFDRSEPVEPFSFALGEPI